MNADGGRVGSGARPGGGPWGGRPRAIRRVARWVVPRVARWVVPRVARWVVPREARWAVLAAVTALALAGCSTGSDAVASGGEFQFVAPGNQTTITYEPAAARGLLGTFSGESLTEPGKQIGVQDFPGQVVLINVWGSWCGPCRAEMADLQLLHDQFSARGVAVLGLDIRDDRQAAADFMRGDKATYPSIFDPAGRALFSLNGYPRNVVPSTIVLDRKHRVAIVYLTRIRLAEVAGALQRLAAESAA